MTFSNAFELINHLLPIIITLFFVAAVFVWRTTQPYLRYTSLVAHADTDVGVIALAKHLARETGGKAINVDSAWQKFVPAAVELHNVHREKKEQLISQEDNKAAHA